MRDYLYVLNIFLKIIHNSEYGHCHKIKSCFTCPLDQPGRLLNFNKVNKVYLTFFTVKFKAFKSQFLHT